MFARNSITLHLVTGITMYFTLTISLEKLQNAIDMIQNPSHELFSSTEKKKQKAKKSLHYVPIYTLSNLLGIH